MAPETTIAGQASANSGSRASGAAIADEAIEQVARGLGDDYLDEWPSPDILPSKSELTTPTISATMLGSDNDAGSMAIALAAQNRETVQKHQSLEKMIREQWELTHCSNLEEALETNTSAGSDVIDEDNADNFGCLRQRALWCLADAEISSSGRNWYLSEAARIDALKERHQMMKKLRNMVVEDLGNLDPVVRGLSFRFVPFGNKRDPKETFIFFLTLVPETSTEPAPPKISPWAEDLEKSAFFRRVEPVTDQMATYEILYRNQVFNVRKIDTAAELDWHTITHYKSFDIKLKWSGIKAIFLRKQSAPRLILEGKIRLPTEFPVPIIALQEANESVETRERVRLVFDKKGKLGITDRIRMFVLFTEIMLSLDTL